MGYWSMFLILLKCTPPYVVTMECWAGAPPCPRGPSLTQKSATTLAFHGTAITYKYSDPFLAPNSSLLTSVPYFPKSSGGWTTPCGHMGLAQPLLKKKNSRHLVSHLQPRALKISLPQLSMCLLQYKSDNMWQSPQGWAPASSARILHQVPLPISSGRGQP